MVNTIPETARSVIKALMESDARRVVKYIAPNLTVKATRLRPVDRRHRGETYVVTFGRPNFAERQFIKAAVKAGEPFPIHRTQRKAFPES